MFRLFFNEKIIELKDIYITQKEELAQIVEKSWNKRFSMIDRTIVHYQLKHLLILNQWHKYVFQLKKRKKIRTQQKKHGEKNKK